MSESEKKHFNVQPEQIQGSEEEWRTKALKTMMWLGASSEAQHAKIARLHECLEGQQRETTRLREYLAAAHVSLQIVVEYMAQLEGASAPTSVAPVQPKGEEILWTSEEIGEVLAALEEK
jgi:hypothetical protein